MSRMPTLTQFLSKSFFIRGRTWTAARKPAHVRVFACDDGKPDPNGNLSPLCRSSRGFVP